MSGSASCPVRLVGRQESPPLSVGRELRPMAAVGGQAMRRRPDPPACLGQRLGNRRRLYGCRRPKAHLAPAGDYHAKRSREPPSRCNQLVPSWRCCFGSVRSHCQRALEHCTARSDDLVLMPADNRGHITACIDAHPPPCSSRPVVDRKAGMYRLSL